MIHAFRRFCKKIIESSGFNGIVMLSVLLNTIVLGTEGLINDTGTQSFLSDLNFTFTIIFTIELALKVTALGVISKSILTCCFLFRKDTIIITLFLFDYINLILN